MSNLPDYLLGGRIIAKPIEQKEEILESGFIIPGTVNADIEAATVVKVDKDITAYVNVGDTVLFAKGAGQGQLINGEPHLWLNVNELWGGVTSPLTVVKDDE
jgi:co-chaperonin GroES (HSP10)